MREKIMEEAKVGSSTLVSITHPYFVSREYHYLFTLPVNRKTYTKMSIKKVETSEYESWKDQQDNTCFYCDFSSLKKFLEEQEDWNLFAVGTKQVSTSYDQIQTHLFFLVKSLDQGFHYQIAEYIFSNAIMLDGFTSETGSPRCVPGFIQLKNTLDETNWRFLDVKTYVHSSEIKTLNINKLSSLYHRNLSGYVSYLDGLDFGVTYLTTWMDYGAIQDIGVGINMVEHGTPTAKTYEVFSQDILEHSPKSISKYIVGTPNKETDGLDLCPLLPQSYVGNLKECGLSYTKEAYIMWSEDIVQIKDLEDGSFIHISELYSYLHDVTLCGVHSQVDICGFNQRYHLYFKTKKNHFLEVAFSPQWKDTNMHDFVWFMESSDPYQTSIFEMEVRNSMSIKFLSVELINLYSAKYIDLIGYIDSDHMQTLHLCPTLDAEIQCEVDQMCKNLSFGVTLFSSNMEEIKNLMKMGKSLKDSVYEFLTCHLPDSLPFF